MEQLLALAYGDVSSNTVVFPATTAGGSGLTVGGGTNTAAPVNTYVDWLSQDGSLLGGGAAAPATWFYERVWQVTCASAAYVPAQACSNTPTAGDYGVPVTATVTSTTGMFVGEWLTTLDGDAAETVAIATIPSATTITACFTQQHLAATTTFRALGGFASGIVAPSLANGSTANKLKLYGDINGDGTMVYIEYYCDNGDAGTTGSFNLYRNVVKPFVPFGTAAAVKPAVASSMVLLSNVHPNPPDTGGAARPCFQYQEPVPASVAGMVLDVAVTLTVWTQTADPITHQFQTETKALLNVSPRNVFFTWEFAGLGYLNRIQPTPAVITGLLP